MANTIADVVGSIEKMGEWQLQAILRATRTALQIKSGVILNGEPDKFAEDDKVWFYQYNNDILSSTPCENGRWSDSFKVNGIITTKFAKFAEVMGDGNDDRLYYIPYACLNK